MAIISVITAWATDNGQARGRHYAAVAFSVVSGLLARPKGISYGKDVAGCDCPDEPSICCSKCLTVLSTMVEVSNRDSADDTWISVFSDQINKTDEEFRDLAWDAFWAGVEIGIQEQVAACMTPDVEIRMAVKARRLLAFKEQEAKHAPEPPELPPQS